MRRCFLNMKKEGFGLDPGSLGGGHPSNLFRHCHKVLMVYYIRKR